MEEEKQKISITNNFDEGSNCQVFNGDITNSVFAMPGSTVNQYATPTTVDATGSNKSTSIHHSEDDKCEPNEELFHFIHPSLDVEEEMNIHSQVKRLVKRQGIQEICAYLQQLAKDKKILLPKSVSSAYSELVRMGMSTGEGFNEKTFNKYYKSK